MDGKDRPSATSLWPDEDVENKAETRSGSMRSNASSLGAYLGEQSKSELIALLTELANAYDDVRRTLEDRQRLASGQTSELLRTIRREIAAVQEPIRDQYGYGFTAIDTARLLVALKTLFQTGQADAAVRFGPELLETGSRTLEYEHEGESAPGFAACLEVLFTHLDVTSLPPEDQITWALDMILADEYDLCGAGCDRFLEKPYAAGDWSTAADRLAQRLDACGTAPDDDEDGFDDEDKGYLGRFDRDQISMWLIHALEKAGRGDEIIPLCEREAPVTLSYVRLVDRLIGDCRWDEAENWCRSGIPAVSNYQGIVAKLRERLRTIKTRTGDPRAALAIQAEEFFADPGLGGFQALCKSARDLRIGKEVEAWARYYLETGRRPGLEQKGQGVPEEDWPLPASDVEMRDRYSEADAPMTWILIDLAIAEEKPIEALKWYDLARSEAGWDEATFYDLDEQLAEAVHLVCPDRAVDIWKRMAEEEIARVVAMGYDAAVPYLRKVKKTLNRIGRGQEWEAYLASLRERNKRRPRCLEALGRLESDRLVIDPSSSDS